MGQKPAAVAVIEPHPFFDAAGKSQKSKTAVKRKIKNHLKILGLNTAPKFQVFSVVPYKFIPIVNKNLGNVAVGLKQIRRAAIGQITDRCIRISLTQVA